MVCVGFSYEIETSNMLVIRMFANNHDKRYAVCCVSVGCVVSVCVCACDVCVVCVCVCCVYFVFGCVVCMCWVCCVCVCVLVEWCVLCVLGK